MRLTLLGAPGAGKGTQAHFIKEHFNIPKISTGDMLRTAIKENTLLGMQVRKFMNSGDLVPDSLILNLIQNRLKERDCRKGYLFDGFPRTLTQAEAMKREKIAISYVIEIDVPFEEIIVRLSGRRIHPASGRTYHIKFNPPKINGIDDETGEKLVQRIDDQEDTIKKRLEIYQIQTRPLIEYYLNWEKHGMELSFPAPTYKRIIGVGDVEDIRNRIFSVLGF